MPVALSTPVYETMLAGKVPPDAEPRKRAMTLEHLLMMRSGFFCDDSNPDAPGNEDKMLDQEDESDYYRYTLRLPLDRDPGAKGVYCSIDPNLALGVLERATGQPVMKSFDRLLAGPLEIKTYAWPLSPAGRRRGHAVPAARLHEARPAHAEWRNLAGSPDTERRIRGTGIGALARTAFDQVRPALVEHRIPVQGPHRARLLRRWQRRPGRIVIPELDLVVANFGGNYADRVGLYMLQELTPNHILPAVREPGDDADTAVTPGNFETPYG
jgi:CubicO group peptidase (beta-lactamase class C family)